jgi:hypothetical protein
MQLSRRKMLLSTLFGAGGLGLRSLATGIPLSFLSSGGRVRAQDACADKARAQFLILSSSAAGDPFNANAPGTYEFPEVVHAVDPRMAATDLTLGTQTVKAAQVWSTLSGATLGRACFFHHATLTNNHPNLPKVMRLMGATAQQEMLASIAAKALAPCLETVQTEPISVGAGEFLTFAGRGLPNLRPTGLRDILSRPGGALSNLQDLRDQSLDRMHTLLKESGTAAQRSYLDSLAASRNEARSLSDELLGALDSIQGDNVAGQITAAITLIRMRVAPVMVVNIPFGGDNHADPDLMRSEVPQTEAGVAAIGQLMDQLSMLGLSDQVTFALWNVFGRTLVKKGLSGRDHWGSHHVSLMIGKGFRGGVIGGITPQAGDYAAMPIDAKSGRGMTSGADIAFNDTLGAMGKTLGAGLGISQDLLDTSISSGKVVTAALL